VFEAAERPALRVRRGDELEVVVQPLERLHRIRECRPVRHGGAEAASRLARQVELCRQDLPQALEVIRERSREGRRPRVAACGEELVVAHLRIGRGRMQVIEDAAFAVDQRADHIDGEGLESQEGHDAAPWGLEHASRLGQAAGA
jgi:hypothetical protein